METTVASNVAMVGLQGVGKTTLAVTLAKRLERPDSNGLCFIPEDSRTEKYVSFAWERLQAREWIGSTEEGKFIDLTWAIQINARRVSSFRVVDVAGQDIYNIFNDDAFRNIESIPEERRNVLNYLADAEIILFLFDLGDFIGESNSHRKIDRAAAIRSALRHLRSKRKKCCLILTQGTRYTAYAREFGYTRRTQLPNGQYQDTIDWRALIAKEAPSLYHEHLRDAQLPVLPFAAVEQTCIIFDGENSVREVPQPGFESRGLPLITSWLKKCIVDRPGPDIPYAEIVEQRAYWTSKFFTSIASLDVIVRNRGADGKIRVIGETTLDGVELETQTKEIWLARNQETTVQFDFQKTTIKTAPNFQANSRCVV